MYRVIKASNETRATVDFDWGNVIVYPPDHDGTYWVEINDDDINDYIEFYATKEGMTDKLIYNMVFEMYSDNGSYSDIFYSDRSEEVGSAIHHLIEEVGDYRKYRVESFYSDDFKGLADSYETSSLDDAVDKAHEMISDGGSIEITNQETGASQGFTYDEYFMLDEDGVSNFEGEAPWNLRELV